MFKNNLFWIYSIKMVKIKRPLAALEPFFATKGHSITQIAVKC